MTTTIARLVRFIAISLIAISIIIGARAQVVQGGTVLRLPLDNIEEYAATNTSILWVQVYQIMIDGYSTVSSRLSSDILNPRLTKDQLDELLRNRMNTLLGEMLTEPIDPDLDLTRELRVSADATGRIGKGGASSQTIEFLDCTSPISFVRVTTGNNDVYTIPDVSQYEMRMNNRIAFRVKGLRWAVQQLYDEEGNFQSYGLKDGKNNSDPDIGWVDATKELLYVDTRLITGEPHTYKVVLNDGAYRVVDGSGVERPEIIPIRTAIMDNSDGTVTVRVLGGDSYRTLVLEESTDFSDWTEIHRVERRPDFYGEQAFQVTLPSSEYSFFRVKGL